RQPGTGGRSIRLCGDGFRNEANSVISYRQAQCNQHLVLRSGPTDSACKPCQLTSDGFRPYKAAVEDAFGMDVDYAMLVKMYSDSGQADTRYSPGEIVDSRPIPIT